MGVADEHGNVLYGLVYAGTGVPQARALPTFSTELPGLSTNREGKLERYEHDGRLSGGDGTRA